MVFELKEKNKILPRLYEDFVSYVEEISLIEEDYLWEDIRVYVADSGLESLILHSPSFYWGGKSLSAYMTAKNPSAIREFAEILKDKRDFQTHLQTSANPSHVKRFMPWLTKAYTVRYCRTDSATFKPTCEHRAKAVRLTPENIKELQPSASSIPYFVKRLETASVYGYVDEKGELIATSGVGFLTKKSFSISYTETKLEYRGRGIAKCLTSLASEPLIKKGMVGVYAADTNNPSSLGVAKALGFQPHLDLKCFYS